MAVPTLLDDIDTSELRKRCCDTLERLKNKRQPWLDFVRIVAQELLPNRLPYLIDPQSDQRGGEQNQHIVDAVGHLSLDTSAAGISNGTMPATSAWFDLVVRNLFEDDEDEKLFLQESARRLLSLHQQSNAPQVFPECQKEWLAFGTGVALTLEDDEDGQRLEALSVGEYCLEEDHRGRVDTLYREFTMTVGQLADEFGKERLSAGTRTHYDNGHYEIPVACVLAIEPDRDGRNPYGELPELPWRSVYFEETAGADQVLAVRGFDRFPALVWRHGKLPGSAYGYGRGMDAVPHLIRLRKLVYRYGQALAFKSEPPLQLPPGVQQHEVRALPGGRTSVMGQQPIQTLFQVQLELSEVAEEMERARQAIRDTLGATLVASLRQIHREMTAREADLRTSQDLAEFLPGIYRMSEELLNPYIEWLWALAGKIGLLPQAPTSLENKVIDIEFTSPLARKQRQGEVDAIVRTFAIAGEFGKARPEVWDNLDVDAAIRQIAEIEGMPVKAIVPFARMLELRAAQMQQRQAEATAAAAMQGVEIAKGAAEASRASVA